jgi:acyl-CoA synthetase (AMP-forming)/AMP-acid ligase II
MLRNVIFYAGCAATWLVVLPVLAVAGFMALVGYALVSYIGDFFFGHGNEPLDTRAAREIARRVCLESASGAR